MSSNATRLEILLEAVPDAVVGMSQKVRRILAGHEVGPLLDRSPGSATSEWGLSGSHGRGSELPADVTRSRGTRGVVLDHGGG